jgi:hypothetical protein
LQEIVVDFCFKVFDVFARVLRVPSASCLSISDEGYSTPAVKWNLNFLCRCSSC